jgi:uncharacterized surface protein with fasciclin (FAS1) repeats
LRTGRVDCGCFPLYRSGDSRAFNAFETIWRNGPYTPSTRLCGQDQSRAPSIPPLRGNDHWEYFMNKIRVAALAAAMGTALLGGMALTAAYAETTVEVGGAPMYPSKNIVENAVNSKDHTTLVAAVKAAGLVATLQSDGPFTVFAPVNKAFEKLPAGTVDTLLKPENKATLTAVLTYHVLAGKYSAADLSDAVKKGGGKATFKTVEGEDLTVTQECRKIEITDAKGGKSAVTIADVNQKNGVIHVVDSVLLPKS